jgi:quinoprotein dehydrogenase-associated probable ABC transporter substrate-binding protein
MSFPIHLRLSGLLLPGLLLLNTAAAAQDAIETPVQPLRFCVDPGNMPLSNKQGEGFQNKVAEILARTMERPLEYYWYPYYGRGLARNTINADRCDVLMDVPSDYERALVTKSYYKSTFVLVYPKSKHHTVRTLDDPILKKWRIGVLQSSPARVALRKHDVFENTELEYAFIDTNINPEAGPAMLVRKVIDGKLDAAEAWGPVAGYYIARERAPLEMVSLNTLDSAIPLDFEMSLGVRHSDKLLRQQLDAALEASKDAIEAVLTDYGIPLVECSECVVSGSLTAHGPYTEIAAAMIASDGDHPVSSPARLEAAKERLAEGGNPDRELTDAVVGNDPARVNYLLSQGANPNEVAELEYNALQWAVREGNIAVARILLEHGADVNLRDRNDWSPLMLAVWRDNAEMVKLLVDHHAELDAYSLSGWNPLSLAITYDKLDRVRQLVVAGANVNVANGAGYTPLMFSTAKSAPGVLDFLLEHGANVGAANKAGITALMIAAAAGNELAVRALLAAGAERGTTDVRGQTALDLANEREHAEVVALLSKS